MKSLKTPLRYPGGKSRACVKLAQYLPDMKQYTEFRGHSLVVVVLHYT